MTLEVLFARAQQGEAFMRMCVCGLALGAALQLSGFLHRRRQWLGNAWDAVWALTLTAAAGYALLDAGGGVRLYALLGLALGAVVYGLGLRQAIAFAARWIGKLCAKRNAGTAGKNDSGGEY